MLGVIGEFACGADTEARSTVDTSSAPHDG